MTKPNGAPQEEPIEDWHLKQIQYCLSFTKAMRLPDINGVQHLNLSFDKVVPLIMNFDATLVNTQTVKVMEEFKERLVEILFKVKAGDRTIEELTYLIKIKIQECNATINTAKDNLVFLREEAEKMIKP